MNKENEKITTDELADLEEIFETYFRTLKRNRNVIRTCNITRQQGKQGVIKKVKISVANICNDCKGTGNKIKFQEQKCKNCCGRGYIYSKKAIVVKIPPKTRNNDYIVFEGKGNKFKADKERGSIFIKIHIYGDRSKRKGNRIYE